MNIVKNIIFDVTDRIGDKFNPGAVVRAMNRVYQSLNREYLCLEKSFTIPENTFSDEVKSFDIPSDFIKEIHVLPSGSTMGPYVYIPKEQWAAYRMKNLRVYTKLAGAFHFGNVNSESVIDISYYSFGLELVEKEDDDFEATQTNTPEWDRDFWALLLYETCFELVPEYPMIQRDMNSAIRLRSELGRHNKNQRSNSPAIMGGPGIPPQRIDPDRVDGLWVMRR